MSLRPALLLAIVLSQIGAPRARADAVELRVVSWNVWDIPPIATHLEARLERMVPALMELAPDLVALQEVWDEEHAAGLLADFREAGLSHAAHIAGEGRKGGLLIASRYPFEELDYTAFTLGRTSAVPWHVDWMADKGVVLVRVQTPAGPVDFANTHMQATYGRGGYLDVRLGQALEAAHALSRARGGARPPLIVGGDFNSRTDDLPRRLLRARAALTDSMPGIDSVLFRDGDSGRLRLLEARRALDREVPLGGSLVDRLSDHDAVLAVLELSRCRGCAPESAGPEPWPRVLTEVGGQLRASLERSHYQMWLARGTVVALALVGLLLLRRSRRRPRWWSVAGVAALLLAGAWFAHVGFVHEPAEVAGLRQMIAQLDR